MFRAGLLEVGEGASSWHGGGYLRSLSLSLALLLLVSLACMYQHHLMPSYVTPSPPSRSRNTPVRAFFFPFFGGIDGLYFSLYCIPGISTINTALDRRGRAAAIPGARRHLRSLPEEPEGSGTPPPLPLEAVGAARRRASQQRSASEFIADEVLYPPLLEVCSIPGYHALYLCNNVPGIPVYRYGIFVPLAVQCPPCLGGKPARKVVPGSVMSCSTVSQDPGWLTQQPGWLTQQPG